MISETMFYSNTSLYVGDLDPYVTEKNLFDKFSECGTVGLVKICRDKITRQSLGYAYVNFQQPADAERALDTLNFELLSNKPMRIMWSQRDPALRKSGVGNVFIKNLDKSIDHKAFYDTFSEFGNIISCKIMLDETGKSKGYGFVHYETEKSAELAIEGANGKLIMGKKVYVGKFLSKFTRSTDSNQQSKPFKNVFVKNFADKLGNQDLFNLFSKFGEITSAKVMLDENEKSKGFGFVNFVQFESAIKAVQEMNNYILEDKTLVVTRFEKKSARLNHLRKEFEEKKKESFRQDLNLYVKNLDEKIDSIRLEKEFEKFGTIISAKVMLDENNNSKGFGFVSFSKQEEAQKALAEMNGRILSTKPLFICIAQRKEDRKRTLANKFKETFQFNNIPLLPNQYYKHQNVTVPRWQNKQSNLMSVQQQYYPKTNQFRNQPMPIQQLIRNEQDEFITYLSSVKPFMQKQVIGERLYVACLNMGHDMNAGKIVGMLLDGMDISELLDLLYNEQLLMTKINEAESVLKIHNERLMHIVQNQNSVQYI